MPASPFSMVLGIPRRIDCSGLYVTFQNQPIIFDNCLTKHIHLPGSRLAPRFREERKNLQGNMKPSKLVRPELDDSESKRIDRNQTEKKRRGRFNGLIDELAIYLADRCHTKKSTEKSSILKLTGEYFLEQEKLAAEKAAKGWQKRVKPAFVADDEFNFVYLESMNMVIIALNQTGQVVYVSDNAQACLGHLPQSILDRNVFEFIGTRDAIIFQRILSLLATTRQSQRLEPFWCQFRRGSHEFETIYCVGTILKNFPKPQSSVDIDVSEYLVLLAKPLSGVPSEKVLSKADGAQTKFTATLTMQGKYGYLDKHVASVLGFFPSELIGKSVYEYCHTEDLENLVEYHRWLLSNGKITTCFYRHRTKGQSWIWLQSRYDVSYSEWDSKPHAVTSLTWVVSQSEVCEKQGEILARDKRKFASIELSVNEGNARKNNSPNSSLIPKNIDAQSCQSEVMEIDGNNLSGKSALEKTARRQRAGSLDSQSDCSSPVSNTNGSEDNQLIDMQESFQFLSSINFPSDLTIAQHTLHKFLEEKYVQVIETINKQSKELLTIQKQIRIQGELRDLLERLEKEKSAEKVENEYRTIQEMMSKYGELREVCNGSRAEKLTAESSAILSARIVGMEVKSCSSEAQGSTANSEQNHHEIAERQQRSYYDQERWLQRQVDQVQWQQQTPVIQQMLYYESTQRTPQDQVMLYRQQLLAEQFQEQMNIQQRTQQQQEQFQGYQQQQKQVRLQHLPPQHLQQPLAHHQMQRIQQQQQMLRSQTNPSSNSNCTSPLDSNFPQDRLPVANSSPHSNNTQENSPFNNHFAQSPCSNDSLYDYQWF